MLHVFLHYLPSKLLLSRKKKRNTGFFQKLGPMRQSKYLDFATEEDRNRRVRPSAIVTKTKDRAKNSFRLSASIRVERCCPTTSLISKAVQAKKLAFPQSKQISYVTVTSRRWFCGTWLPRKKSELYLFCVCLCLCVANAVRQKNAGVPSPSSLLFFSWGERNQPCRFR